jgi:hypothetical protein
MLRTLSLASLVLATSFVACASEEILEDGENDAFDLGDGKADGDGLTEGSPTAAAVLKVASEASKAVLTGEVKISARTADNIITARAAGPFATLAALDAVPWVGPVALEQLVAYVEAKGLVGGGASPMAAVAARKSWSGTYWGMLDGALARGWSSAPRKQYSESEVRAFDACLSSYTSTCKTKISTMAGTNGEKLSPLMKFDFMVRKQLEAKYGTGGAPTSMYSHAAKWELDNHYIGNNTSHRYWSSRGYAGKCIGWALANFDYAEPTTTKKLDGVTFTPADIKGLLASIYNGAQFFIPEDKVIGHEFHDNPGSDSQEYYDDVGPHELVQALFATVAKGTLLEGDLEPGDGVWNYPIHEYKLTIKSQSARKATVDAKLYYSNDEVPYDFVSPTDRSDILSRTLSFELDLPTGWNGDLGKATGGRWLGESQDTHPDVLILGIEPGWRDAIYDYRNTDMNTEVNFPLLKRAQLRGNAWTPIVDDLLARYYE